MEISVAVQSSSSLLSEKARVIQRYFGGDSGVSMRSLLTSYNYHQIAERSSKES